MRIASPSFLKAGSHLNSPGIEWGVVVTEPIGGIIFAELMQKVNFFFFFFLIGCFLFSFLF